MVISPHAQDKKVTVEVKESGEMKRKLCFEKRKNEKEVRGDRLVINEENDWRTV